jgi:hypothetical protein
VRKVSWTICRIPVWPFDDKVKARQTARPNVTGTAVTGRRSLQKKTVT